MALESVVSDDEVRAVAAAVQTKSQHQSMQGVSAERIAQIIGMLAQDAVLKKRVDDAIWTARLVYSRWVRRRY